MTQPEHRADAETDFVLFPNVKPTIATGSFFRDIDPELLLWHLQQGGRRPKAGSIDLDSTIIAQEAMEVPEEELAVIKRFFELGVRLGIDSNAADKQRDYRVQVLGRDLSEQIGEKIVAVTTYQLGGRWYHRKPFRAPFDETARRMGVANHEMFHIDDQVGKGILGANRAGYMGSVAVEPCAPETDPKGVRLAQRPIEKKLLEHWGAPFSQHGAPSAEEEVSEELPEAA